MKKSYNLESLTGKMKKYEGSNCMMIRKSYDLSTSLYRRGGEKSPLSTGISRAALRFRCSAAPARSDRHPDIHGRGRHDVSRCCLRHDVEKTEAQIQKENERGQVKHVRNSDFFRRRLRRHLSSVPVQAAFRFFVRDPLKKSLPLPVKGAGSFCMHLFRFRPFSNPFTEKQPSGTLAP